MPPQVLDYAPPTEFDTGRFVAHYLQFLALISIAMMIAGPVYFDSLHIDFSPIFLFWAAWALKRRSRVARKWVLGFAWLILGAVVLMCGVAAIRGTDGFKISFGMGLIKNPTLWQLLLVGSIIAGVTSVPLIILMSARARRQFAAGPDGLKVQ